MTVEHVTGVALVVLGVVAVLAVGAFVLAVACRISPPDPPRRTSRVPYDEVERQRLKRESHRREERRSARQERRTDG